MSKSMSHYLVEMLENGGLHPITQTLNHIESIFTKGGFDVELGT